jgi:hypothetical protein
MISLKDMSAQELRLLAEKAIELADDMDGEFPTKRMALEQGIEDITIVGFPPAYRGSSIVTMSNGDRWEATGNPITYDEHFAYHGYIDFSELKNTGKKRKIRCLE